MRQQLKSTTRQIFVIFKALNSYPHHYYRVDIFSVVWEKNRWRAKERFISFHIKAVGYLAILG